MVSEIDVFRTSARLFAFYMTTLFFVLHRCLHICPHADNEGVAEYIYTRPVLTVCAAYEQLRK